MTFREILDQYQIPYRTAGEHEHARSGWLNFDCPFCSKDWQHFRMGYNEAGHYCSCWNCSFKPLVETLHLLIDRPYPVCRQLLADIIYKKARGDIEQRGELIIPLGVEDMKQPHVEYLEKRGFDAKHLANFWGMRGIGLAPKLSWRLWIPIHYHGEIVSWTTRSIVDQGTRYINAGTKEERMKAKNLLFGEDHARHTIIVTEGPTDVFRIGPGAVAVMGVAYTAAQVRKISTYPRRVICFDSEPAAQHRAKQLCSVLEVFTGKTYNVTLKAKDPGEASKQEIQELRKEFLQ